jgi:hypothetical protein
MSRSNETAMIDMTSTDKHIDHTAAAMLPDPQEPSDPSHMEPTMVTPMTNTKPQAWIFLQLSVSFQLYGTDPADMTTLIPLEHIVNNRSTMKDDFLQTIKGAILSVSKGFPKCTSNDRATIRTIVREQDYIISYTDQANALTFNQVLHTPNVIAQHILRQYDDITESKTSSLIIRLSVRFPSDFIVGYDGHDRDTSSFHYSLPSISPMPGSTPFLGSVPQAHHDDIDPDTHPDSSQTGPSMSTLQNPTNYQSSHGTSTVPASVSDAHTLTHSNMHNGSPEISYQDPEVNTPPPYMFQGRPVTINVRPNHHTQVSTNTHQQSTAFRSTHETPFSATLNHNPNVQGQPNLVTPGTPYVPLPVHPNTPTSSSPNQLSPNQASTALAEFLKIYLYTPELYIARLTNGVHMDIKHFLKKEYIPLKDKLTWPIWYQRFTQHALDHGIFVPPFESLQKTERMGGWFHLIPQEYQQRTIFWSQQILCALTNGTTIPECPELHIIRRSQCGYRALYAIMPFMPSCDRCIRA